MLYGRRWWYGTVTMIEALESSSSEDEPLSLFVSKNHNKNCCEYVNCHNPILTTCAECTAFLCIEHFENGGSCSNHVLNKTSLPEIKRDCYGSFSNIMDQNLDTLIEDTSTRHDYQKFFQECWQCKKCLKTVWG
ncbi:unnamed protein product [Colias eurytheme]|nr:unnamed protein product [Colias eurytheme]